jgi:hypothetical protein
MRKTISEPAREIPVAAEADVVVCGGGPGGVPAAIAAARHGATVVLIERYGFMGGLATAGLVAPILAHKAHAADFAIVEGILREITERMHALGGAPRWEETLKVWGINFDAECLKIVLDEMCQEAGVELMLHSTIANVAMRDGKIAAVLVENKSGRQAVAGRVFVDATGDADVAFRAGAPTTHGRAWDGRPESLGSFIHLAGFAYPDEARRKEIVARVQDEMAAGRLSFYNAGFLARNAYHVDHTSANMSRCAGDSECAADMTRAELSVRRDAWALVRFLRANVPGFEECYVQQLSPQVGPRESRQIVGPYALNGDDIHLGRKYPDAIARGSWWIDIHCPLGNTYPVHLCRKECPKGTDCPFFAAEYERMRTNEELYPPEGDWYDIPYRCLLSVGVPNLLSSGRCISATHEGMAGSRVMGTCVALGQAAGTAAALAARAGVDPAAVDVAGLQDALRRDGQLV